MSLTITHQDRNFNSWTKDDLRRALNLAGVPNVNKCSKELLVAAAEKVQQTLLVAHENELAEVEKVRLAQVETEKAAGVTTAVHTQLAETFRKIYNDNVEIIKGYQAKIATADPETNGVCTELEWHTDDIFKAYAMMEKVVHSMRYFEAQATEQTKTAAETLEYIKEAAYNATECTLSVSVSQSTNPIANVRYLEDLKAQGQMAKVLNRLAKQYTKMIAESDPLEAKYLFMCL